MPLWLQVTVTLQLTNRRQSGKRTKLLFLKPLLDHKKNFPLQFQVLKYKCVSNWGTQADFHQPLNPEKSH